MPHHLNLRVIIAQGLIFAFLFNSFGPLPLAQAQDFALPAPGVRVGLSPAFNPPILKGIKIHPDNPFRFDFILDKGDEGAQAHKSTGAQEEIKSQATKLIKYFLASLTIPEKDLWVNLSPYEKNRIVPESFGQTEMGRDLLAEDYMLKQITASLIYPQGETGKRFWKRIYEESAKKFGTTNIPVNTFNKVWIVPDKAVVYENAKAGTAYVVESKLKVMLEEDYLALSKNSSPLESPPPNLPHQGGGISALGSQIIREIVIPELIKEVNQGKNFSQLRQVYNSLILATWYKKKIKDSILEQVYADKNKIKGVEYNNSLFNGGQPGDTFRERCPQAGCQANQGLNVKATQRNVPNDVEIIYQRYLQAFKKGAYNYIKEEIDPISQQTIPRKYFSGGIAVFGYLENVEEFTSHIPEGVMSNDQAMVVETQLNQAIINQKTVAAMEGRVSKPADAAMNDEKEESQSKEDKIVFNSSVPLLINQIQNFTETQKIFSGRFFKKDLEDVNSLFKMLRNFLKYGSYSIDLVAEILTNALLYSGNGNNVTVNAGLNINPEGITIFKMTIHQDFISDNDWHILVRNSRLKTWAEKNRENRLNNGLAQREGKGLYRFFVLSQMGQPMILEYVRKGEALDTVLWVKVYPVAFQGDQSRTVDKTIHDAAMTGAGGDEAMLGNKEIDKIGEYAFKKVSEALERGEFEQRFKRIADINRLSSSTAVFELEPGVQVIRKDGSFGGEVDPYRQNQNYNIDLILQFSKLKRPFIVPLFVPSNDNYYYELDLRPYGYQTLSSIMEENESWLTKKRLQQIKSAVNRALQPKKGEWFDSGYLHRGNILLLLDKGKKKILDIRIIDFKELTQIPENSRNHNLETGNFEWESDFAMKSEAAMTGERGASLGDGAMKAVQRKEEDIQRQIDEIDKLLYGTHIAEIDEGTVVKLKARRKELQKELEEVKAFKRSQAIAAMKAPGDKGEGAGDAAMTGKRGESTRRDGAKRREKVQRKKAKDKVMNVQPQANLSYNKLIDQLHAFGFYDAIMREQYPELTIWVRSKETMGIFSTYRDGIPANKLVARDSMAESMEQNPDQKEPIKNITIRYILPEKYARIYGENFLLSFLGAHPTMTGEIYPNQLDTESYPGRLSFLIEMRATDAAMRGDDLFDRTLDQGRQLLFIEKDFAGVRKVLDAMANYEGEKSRRMVNIFRIFVVEYFAELLNSAIRDAKKISSIMQSKSKLDELEVMLRTHPVSPLLRDRLVDFQKIYLRQEASRLRGARAALNLGSIPLDDLDESGIRRAAMVAEAKAAPKNRARITSSRDFLLWLKSRDAAMKGGDGAMKTPEWISVRWRDQIFEALSQINHVSLPKVRKYGQEKQVQIVHGDRLSQKLISLSDEKFERQIVDWFLNIAEGLALLEAKGMRHGDINASNIIIENNSNNAVLIDWSDEQSQDLMAVIQTIKSLPSIRTLGRLSSQRGGLPAGLDVVKLIKESEEVYSKGFRELLDGHYQNMENFYLVLKKYHELNKIDEAMAVFHNHYSDKQGGIDLTSDKALSVQNNGQGIKFHIDPAMLQQLQNTPGFVPVIINIQPLKDLKSFLGLNNVLP